jgi:3-hydroxyisobutyrate dehydrogenase
MAKLGFIGLGNMGAPMAANLIAMGHRVTGYDPAPYNLDGIMKAEVAGQVAPGRDLIFTMLPDGESLLSVYEEILPSVTVGACLVDCSTVDVESARKAHAMAAKAGLLSLDAPVSGGVAGAAAGTLTFMAGGREAAFEAARPFLEIIGSKAVHCGNAGAGQTAKICNNMILGVSMIAVCEAFNLADRLGLSRQALFDVVSTSSGACWSVNSYCPAPGIGPHSPADQDYRPGFAAELMLKDLKLSQQAATSVDARTDIGALATRLYERFLDEGGKGKDFSAMLPYFAGQSRKDQ